MGHERTYRHAVHHDTLISFRVAVKETDVHVHADRPLDTITREIILRHRGYLEAYIERHPEFLTSLVPWRLQDPVPLIVANMAEAGNRAAVGPMAAVAGAIAECVGLDLLAHTDQVMVENGGDIFIKTHGEVIVGLYAGRSPLSMRMGLRIDSVKAPVGVCTSSGTIGHSLSMGSADAVCVVSGSCALADAAATAIGNRIQSPADIQPAIDFGKSIEGARGIVVIMGEQMGLWGDLSVIPLSKKGLSFSGYESK